MTDFFLLLMLAGAGDELQGIKRGIMELADLVCVNKADGDLALAAGRSKADYANALHLMRPKWQAWTTTAMACSALEDRGIDAMWAAVEDFHTAVSRSGELAVHRADQAQAWFWSEVHDGLNDRLHAQADLAALIDTSVAAVRDGTLSPTAAATRVLDAFGA
jgi:LAO/AO transport system kinase